MTSEITTALIGFLSSAAGLAAMAGVGRVVGAIAKRRSDANAKRIEDEGKARVIEAEALKERARGYREAEEREDDTVKLLLAERATTEKRNAERIDRLEARVDECEKRHDECERHNADLRADNGLLIGRVDALQERLTRVERRATPPQPMEAAFLRAAKDEDEG